MFLVDTSYWVAHFSGKTDLLQNYLLNQVILTHDLILGELMLGHFQKKQRNYIFELLTSINRLPMSSHEDVVSFATKQRLAGKGIGWIDAHLLHSCWVNQAGILTLDKNLKKMASSLRIKT
ncbi:MAG TPA: PIN domain-containing protein [Pseudobdellovibrionaceae bacterium]|nr:PIN domain-containing protein [Pseudobdellovibrionaceae bacterium]